MPMIAFVPWAKADDSMRFGDFHVVPFGEALTRGEVPPDHLAGLESILAAYGKKRRVDRAGVPIIRQDRFTLTTDLSEDEVGEYFGFRRRLAFAALASRRFFSGRYLNSDNLLLVIQGYFPDRTGSIAVTTRRRDGQTTNIIAKRGFTEDRPHHVSGWCAMPRDLDEPLLHSLERAAAGEFADWRQMDDALQLFVGANTDNTDIDLHTELIDLMSAFSRLFGVWSEDETVAKFLAVLPSPARSDDTPNFGPKLSAPLMVRELERGHSIREAWLSDAYRLRGSYSHGDVSKPGYPAIWRSHEHLLLGAVAFPLVVKAVLARAGLYSMTADDQLVNEMFDVLATFDAFAPDPMPRHRRGDDSEDASDHGRFSHAKAGPASVR